jgi:hypothetical protein
LTLPGAGIATLSLPLKYAALPNKLKKGRDGRSRALPAAKGGTASRVQSTGKDKGLVKRAKVVWRIAWRKTIRL